MIQIICNFLGISPPCDEVSLILGVMFLTYFMMEFMNFIWSIYKAVFRHG